MGPQHSAWNVAGPTNYRASVLRPYAMLTVTVLFSV